MKNTSYTENEMGDRPERKNKKIDTIEVCAVLISVIIVGIILTSIFRR